MLVTDLTRQAFPVMRRARRLRAAGNAEPWRLLEERFGRDFVNYLAMVMRYKRRWRALRNVV